MLKDNEILKTSCTTDYYSQPELAKSVEDLFQGVQLVPSDEKFYSAGKNINKLDGTSLLIEWIEEYLLSVKDQFNRPNAQGIKFNSSWAIKLHKGSRVFCHHHHDSLDGVAIFYYSAPPEGSNLVFVNNGIVNKPISEQFQENCRVVKLMTGDLITHTSSSLHGVDAYTNSVETIAFVFDFNYIN